MDKELRILIHEDVPTDAELLKLEMHKGGRLFPSHKQSEEALGNEREKLETVTQNMGAGLAFISKDYRIIWANKVLKQIFGAIEGEICHLTYNKSNEICPGCGVREIFEKGSEKVVHEQEGKDLEGNTIWSEIVATSVKDKDGNITAALELVIPITERKKLEAQLRQAQKMEAIGQLAGGIAHDFNNALTLIKTCSELTLFDLKESDPLREKIEMILEATNRSADLAHRLLAFSRRQVMDMKVLDLNNLLKDLDKMLRRVIGEDIELVNVLAEDLGRVKVDPGQVEQVVLNLALNAKDAMPRGGKLTIETANVELDETYSRTHVDVIPGRYVMLAVSDTGIGMTPEIKNRLFEPFFTTKEKGKGTGLGLAMVYGIVKQSGGNIWVYSEAGMGTTFKVYLPRVDEPLEEKKKRKPSEGELPRGGETVLAVEDNKDVRRMAAQILRRQGYRVLEAANGGEALLVCEKLKEEIHLLLTDVVMPGMSGRELAHRLSFLRPEMKILYMSGYSDDSIVSYGILNEKVSFIPKPFSLEALVNQVREVLDK
jgi:PAS domain S-box-containing protein